MGSSGLIEEPVSFTQILEDVFDDGKNDKTMEKGDNSEGPTLEASKSKKLKKKHRKSQADANNVSVIHNENIIEGNIIPLNSDKEEPTVSHNEKNEIPVQSASPTKQTK